MTEREEFTVDKARLGTTGKFLIFLGLACLAVLFLLPQAEAPIIVVFVVASAASIGLGLKDLLTRGQTGVQVVVDAEGITVLRLGPDPIPWAEVERCELVIAGRGTSWVRLHLRHGSPTAARLGTGKVSIHDMALIGGIRGVRQAIARLAPQVPRNW